MFKRNQVMITALAIMIAVAGYLNFAGTKVGEEELADVGASAGQESDMEALLELSDEDGKEDIASLDSDTEDVAAENFLNENMQTISDQDVAALTDDAADSAEEALDAEVQEYAETVREQCAEEVEKLAPLQKMWALRKPILDAHILSLQEKVLELEQEIDEIVIERIMDHRAVLVNT